MANGSPDGEVRVIKTDSAGRPSQPGGGRLQKLQRGGLQQGMGIDRLPLQGLVGIPLREPLETGHITIARAAQRAEFPARFQMASSTARYATCPGRCRPCIPVVMKK